MARILVVDDDVKTARSIGKHLSRVGHECALETSGSRAVETAKSKTPDLLILDVMLPDVSGFEVCRRVRRDAELYAMPILVVSAMDGHEEVMHGLAQGADDYLAKPFSGEELTQRVTRLLRASGTSGGKDPLTELADGEAFKRELQKRISLQEQFAFACVELTNLRDFGRRTGGDARERAIRHLARGLMRCGASFKEGEFSVGHMGGGHFVVVLPESDARAYCERVRETWLAHRERFYESISQGKAYHEASAPGSRAAAARLLDVLCCITAGNRQDASSTQRVFEITSRLRQKALQAIGAGVYVDQRSAV